MTFSIKERSQTWFKNKWIRIAKGSFLALSFLLIIDIGYILGIAPEWNMLERGPIQKSNFIKRYEYERTTNDYWPALQWQPITMSSIPPHVVHTFLVAEDSRFYEHSGFDKKAFKEAMEFNFSKRKFIFGASTISQQTVKNLFLTSSKTPLRKWHEFWVTLLMERNISKRRIIEIYLNIAQFGLGVYGIDAASQTYWNISANNLTQSQAIELAATLPSPTKNNPQTRTTFFLNQIKKIQRNMRLTPSDSTPRDSLDPQSH